VGAIGDFRKPWIWGAAKRGIICFSGEVRGGFRTIRLDTWETHVRVQLVEGPSDVDRYGGVANETKAQTQWHDLRHSP
jgi:hypothetical protein